MPPLDERGQAALEHIASAIAELERLCLEIDAALSSRNWNRLNAAIADSRRVTHEVENAFGEAAAYRTPGFDEVAFARLQQIFSYRDERLASLQAIHDEIGQRLKQLSLWKTYARSFGSKDKVRRSAGLDATS